MKKKNLICFLIFSLSLYSYSQVNKFDFVETIFDALYQSDRRPDNYTASKFPNPFIDINSNSTQGKKLIILSHLDYKDGITPFDRATNFFPNDDINKAEVIKSIVEAWDMEIVIFANSPFNDVSVNNKYYKYLSTAFHYGMITGGTINPYLLISRNEVQKYISWIVNSQFHPISLSSLKNLDNYFVPSNLNSDNLGFLRGIEQGVFNHYAKNSFVIPDRKLNLNFSHYYSTQMVEVPQSYFPIQPLGRGWTHTYNSYVVRGETFNAQTGASTYLYKIKWSDGSIHIYDINDKNYLTLGVYDDLDESSDKKEIIITKKNQSEYYFKRLDNDEEIFYLVKIKDSNDNEININYETSDVDNDYERIEYVEAPSGKKLRFYYHRDTDLLDSITDPIGRKITFEFNENRLKYFNDAKNQETNYYYVSNDEDAPDKNQYKRFLLKRVKLPRGNSIRAEYDNNGNGKLTEYQVNDNLPIEIDVKHNYSNATIPVTAEMILTSDSGNEQILKYDFNTNGLITSFSSEISDLKIEYPNPTNKNSLLPNSINKNGLNTVYSYDNDGNIKSIKVGNNAQENFWYDGNNNLEQHRDENGNSTYFKYENNNLISIEDALGNFVNLTYDSFGQVKSIENQEGITVNYEYENDGAVKSISAPEELTSSFTYDGINRLLTQSINGQNSSYTYDENDNILTHTNIGGLITTFDYDKNDNLVKIINANNISTEFIYNDNDQVVNEKFGELEKNYEYNDVGNIESYIKPSGKKINYTYTNKDQLNSSGTITDINYYTSNSQKRGLIKSIYNDNGHYEFDYDEFNRVNWIKNDFGENSKYIHYEYDNVGNITKIDYPSSSHNIEYKYDKKNRNYEIKHKGKTIVSYSYRKDDLLKKVKYKNAIEGEYFYDAAGRKTGVSYSDKNGILFSENVTLDNKGNILSEDRYYRYNPVYTDPLDTKDESYTYNDNNHLEKNGENNFTVDKDGNTTFRTTRSNNSGSNDSGEAEIEYDIDDNLISISNSNIPWYNKTYSYDPYGNRIEKNDGNRTEYVWDILNNNVLVVIDGNGDITNLYNFYGTTGLEFSVHGDNDESKYFFYLGDLRGSVVVVGSENDDSTISYSFNKYDDFGKLLSGSYASFGHEHYKYLGKHGITLEGYFSGHYYIKARHYDALLGRFFTQDPIWSNNLYPYADNNPISGIDRNGLFVENVYNSLVEYGADYFYENYELDDIELFIETATFFKDGKYLGTGYFENAFDYYSNQYTKAYLNGDSTFLPTVGLIGTSFWRPETYQATAGAIGLPGTITNSKSFITKYFGKTGKFKVLDIRRKFGKRLKVIFPYLRLTQKTYTDLNKIED